MEYHRQVCDDVGEVADWQLAKNLLELRNSWVLNIRFLYSFQRKYVHLSTERTLHEYEIFCIDSFLTFFVSITTLPIQLAAISRRDVRRCRRCRLARCLEHH